MKRSINTMVLTCAHILLQWWYFTTPTSATGPFDLGELSYLKDVDYHKDWHISPGSSAGSSKDQLIRYLDKTPEQRKQSPPFFFLPSHLRESNLPPDTSPEGLKALNLMNQMLQSPVDDWPKQIPGILNTEPSFRVKNFWGFIWELADFMTTPVLQKTLIELKKHEKVMESWDKLIYKQVREVLSDVLIRYETKMQEHIGLLELGNNSGKVMNIFTREEQEKLGEYTICLDPKWTDKDAMTLYKLWVSHLSTYMDVQGSVTVKRILESQAIQVSWMTKDTFNAESKMHAVYENSLRQDCQDLTREIVASVLSLDNQSFEQLQHFQRQDYYGIYDALFDGPGPKDKQVFIFWVKQMPFFLEMVSREDTKAWQCHMSILIEENPREGHLESIMEQFFHHKSSRMQGNLINRFLEFAHVIEKSEYPIFKSFIEESLREMRETDIPWIWKEKMKFMEDMKDEE